MDHATQDYVLGYFQPELSKLAVCSDPVALILLDKPLLQPGTAKPGWGKGSGRFRNVLSRMFAIKLLTVGRSKGFRR